MNSQNNNQKSRFPKEWLPRYISILGAARSGLATVKYLLKKGISVFLSDTCTQEKLSPILTEHKIAHIPHEANGHSDKVLEGELIICSPGIPSDIDILKAARSRGIPVWSEVELGYRQSQASFLAITGSTGKSTTVSLLGSLLHAAHKEHVVAGNIGLPIISSAPQLSKHGFVIAEISSFQLENIDLFKPKVAAILNLMKNHLDRYPSEEDYYNAKKAIIRNMVAPDTIILNASDHRLFSWAEEIKGQVRIIYFGRDVKDADSIWWDNQQLLGKFSGKRTNLASLDMINLAGIHNRENICSAVAMASILGIEKEAIAQGLSDFKGLPHRLEFVRKVNGVSYYNDSKATTAESIVCAINAFHKNVHLIAGGRDKGCEFSIVNDSIAHKVKSVYLIGEATERLANEWQGLTQIIKSKNLEVALSGITQNCLSGDTVILSPGCSSFDMFSSFEDRGDRFKALVMEIKDRGQL